MTLDVQYLLKEYIVQTNGKILQTEDKKIIQKKEIPAGKQVRFRGQIKILDKRSYIICLGFCQIHTDFVDIVMMHHLDSHICCDLITGDKFQ